MTATLRKRLRLLWKRPRLPWKRPRPLRKRPRPLPGRRGRDGAGAGLEGFADGPWRDAVDVRDFIQRNYTPYEGDDSFLAGPTERTTAVWRALTDRFPEERAKGAYDVSYDVPPPSPPTPPAGSTATGS